jgi:hypothetical protein
LQLYLTGILKCTFLRENAKNRAVYGGKNQQQRAFTTRVLTMARRHGIRRDVYVAFTSPHDPIPFRCYLVLQIERFTGIPGTFLAGNA